MMLRAFSEGEGDFLKFRMCALGYKQAAPS